MALGRRLGAPWTRLDLGSKGEPYQVEDDNDPKPEFWELPEKSEGFDVYHYDARRARQGQLVTLLIFLLAIGAFVLAARTMWQAREDGAPPQRIGQDRR